MEIIMPAEHAPKLEPHMKLYHSLLDAIRAHMDWLDSQGKLNLAELERAQIMLGLPPEHILSKEMLRLFRKGTIKTIAADRAEGFCRAAGLEVMIIGRNHPENLPTPTPPNQNS
jgi:hypothetical protein